MRKILFAGLILLIGASFAFANSGDPEPDPTGTLVLDAYVTSNEERPDYSPDGNRLVGLLEERFDVTFDFIVTPEESADEKKSLLLASGDYPSIFFHGAFTKPERQRYGRLGVLLPLNDLIEEKAPNIAEIIANDKPYVDAITAPDGNIYGLAGSELCYHCFYTPKMFINTVWLDNLGLDMPQTTDEYADVLRAFKNGDPNGNGLADEIPFSGAQQSWFMEPRGALLSGFVYVNIENYLLVEDGQVKLAAAEPGFRDGLLWANGLFEEGLIDPLGFTQNEDAFTAIAQNPDGMIVGSYVSGVQTIGFDYPDGTNWLEYDVMPPLEGPSGHRMATFRGPEYAEAGFALTNKASDAVAEKALELMNFLFTTEGALSAMWGPQGGIWDWARDGVLGTRGQPAVFERFVDQIEDGVTYGFEPPFYIDFETWMAWGQDQDINIEAGFERRITLQSDVVAQWTPEETLPSSYWMSDEDADRYGQYLTEFQSYIDQNLVAFITGQKDIASEWDDFQDGLKALGLDDYLGLVQDAYDAN